VERVEGGAKGRAEVEEGEDGEEVELGEGVGEGEGEGGRGAVLLGEADVGWTGEREEECANGRGRDLE
jgi:hypothetical protein